MRPGPARHHVAVALALVGVAVSAYTWHVASQLGTGNGFATMLCKPGTALDCEVVLTSRWGRLLDVSVAVWGMLAFAAGVALALPGALGGRPGGIADLALLGLASASLGFALVLFAVAVVGLRTACLFCLTMDAIVLAWFVTVAPLARSFAPGARSWLQRRTTAQGALAGGLAVAVAAGTAWALYPGPGTAHSRDDVCSRTPEFCRYWDGLPRLPNADVSGTARHAKGAADAPLVIVEFSDFQCPACAAAYERLRTSLSGRRDVRLVFRHFPLDSRCNPTVSRPVHELACTAAAAAECAGQQGKFWDYHDRLFAEQRFLDRETLFRFARELGLDIPRFRSCLDDPATLASVTDDIAAATALGIESTPTLFVNGRRLEGVLEPPYWEFALVLARHDLEQGSRP